MRIAIRCLAMLFCSLGLLIIQAVAADSVGPAVVATVDRALWPESIDNQVGFDKASRAAQLIYVHSLHGMQTMTDADMLAAFKIKSVNRSSVDQWVDAELSLTLNNYQLAAKSCLAADWTCISKPKSVDDLVSKANVWMVKIPTEVASWRDSLTLFSHTYIAEQMRLAALFPKVTSEIAIFNNNEWTGAKLTDREFYLTFDDGPTKAHGTTDETLAMLKAQNKSGAFFVLGANFQARVNANSVELVKELYGNQCVALHGWEHQSHAKWATWQDSIMRTQILVAKTVAQKNLSPLFRPPYGQRKSDSEDFFKAQHLRVALWNIDSQDWNSHMNADAVENRIVALMLIKRHGVILFHDIHPKAKLALPKIFSDVGNAVNWQDCHTLADL